VTDATDPNFTNTQNLVTAAQTHINEKVPDFISYNATPDGDNGLQYYRSHFDYPLFPTPITGDNGFVSGTEAGGDMGGCIHAKPPAGSDVTNERVDNLCTTP